MPKKLDLPAYRGDVMRVTWKFQLGVLAADSVVLLHVREDADCDLKWAATSVIDLDYSADQDSLVTEFTPDEAGTFVYDLQVDDVTYFYGNVTVTPDVSYEED